MPDFSILYAENITGPYFAAHFLQPAGIHGDDGFVFGVHVFGTNRIINGPVIGNHQLNVAIVEVSVKNLHVVAHLVIVRFPRLGNQVADRTFDTLKSSKPHRALFFASNQILYLAHYRTIWYN